MRLGGLLATLLLLATGCGGESSGSRDELAENEKQVSRETMGKQWPLKVDGGVLRCDGAAGTGAVVFVSEDGTEYAVNGLAEGDDSLAEIRPIWANDRELGMGLKKDIGPLIDQGLALCK
jgi:hypothetical protein